MDLQVRNSNSWFTFDVIKYDEGAVVESRRAGVVDVFVRGLLEVCFMFITCGCINTVKR